MHFFKIAFLLMVLSPTYSTGQEELKTIESRLQIVNDLIDSADYDRALRLNRKILIDYIFQNEKSDTTEAKIYNHMSSIFVKTAKIDSAIVYANSALQLLNEKHIDHIERSKSYNYLGLCYYKLADYNKAIEFLNKGLDIVMRTFGDDHLKATTYYGNLSLCHNEIGEPKRAIEYLEKNLVILSNQYGENHINVAKTYNNLGAVFYNLGDYERVLDYSFKTLKIKSEILGDSHPSVGSTYVNIGSMYREKRNYKKSIDYVEKGLLILKKSLGDDHPYLTFGYKTLGGVYKQLNNYPKAIEYYDMGIKLIQNNYGKDHIRVGGIYHELGELNRKLKNYEEANSYAQKALNIFLNKNNSSKEVAVTYELLGSIQYSKEAFDKAIEDYQKALNFYNNLSLKGPNRAIPYMNIGSSYCRQYSFAKARIYFDSSAYAIQYNFNHPFDFDRVSNKILLRRLINKKRTYYEQLHLVYPDRNYLDSIHQNDLHAIALEDYFQTELSEQEARTFHFDEAFWRYEVAIENLFEKNSITDLKKAFEVSEKSKSRILTENFRSVEAKKIAGIPQILLDQEHQYDVDLAFFDKKLYQEKYETNTPNDSLVKEFNARIFQINRQREKLIQTFRDKYPAYHRLKYDQNTAGISDIQLMLQKDQALVEYFVGDSSIYIFVITTNTFHVKSIKKDFPLEEWVTALRENIYSFWMLEGQSDDRYLDQINHYIKYAHLLYDKLVLPIQSSLPEKLIIVPDGALNIVPFESLLSEIPEDINDLKAYAYLLKQYQISYNYSATLFKEMFDKNIEVEKNFVLAFAPTFSEDTIIHSNLTDIRSGFGHLKYNTEEAKTVQYIIGGDLVLGDRATENYFLQVADQYQIIHLSTHGKSNDQMGDYSFIAFSEIKDSVLDNERLYVRELYNMQLNADMVVLSACETGLGEIKRGEGLIGLARGFTYAGATSTVTSLWNVNDIQTTRLMERFYTNIKSGMSKDAALRQAKLSYLTEENHADPYFWSGFIAAGNMAPIDFQKKWHWWQYGLIVTGMLGLALLFMRLRQSFLIF